jgi:hypothetical protein
MPSYPIYQKSSKIKVVTGKVRFSYVNVFTPLPSEDNRPPKYSICLLIPKEDEETVNAINLAVHDIKHANKHIWEGVIPEDLKGGLRDGDLEKNDPAYDNHYFINATSTTKPHVVYEDLQTIKNPFEFYSGCYGRAAITFYAHNSYGGAGVGCTINNLMKIADGERLGGGSSPAEDFVKSK